MDIPNNIIDGTMSKEFLDKELLKQGERGRIGTVKLIWKEGHEFIEPIGGNFNGAFLMSSGYSSYVISFDDGFSLTDLDSVSLLKFDHFMSELNARLQK